MSAGVDNTPAEQIIHDATMNVAVEVALNAITVAVPFLGFPVIKQIFFFLSKKLIDSVYVEIAKKFAFTFIAMVEENHRSDYEEAKEKLRMAIDFPVATQKDESDAEIQKAITEYKAKLRALIVMPTKPIA